MSKFEGPFAWLGIGGLAVYMSAVGILGFDEVNERICDAPMLNEVCSDFNVAGFKMRRLGEQIDVALDNIPLLDF